MRGLLALTVAMLSVVACSDNGRFRSDSLVAAHDLVIVAHADDDLLFMQPDLAEAVAAGTGVTTVYVTAGDDRKGIHNVERRDRALMVAYAADADADWRCGWIEIAGHAANHCRLDAANVSLVFLDYPDGGILGKNQDSLLNLWEGNIASAKTVAKVATSYDREGLVQTLTAIVTATHPDIIRTLEVADTHGSDHSDHMVAGALALLADARAGSTAELLSYRGYNTRREPANEPVDMFDVTFEMFARYEACAMGCGVCGETCGSQHTESDYLAYSVRRYAQGFRRSVAGVMRSAGQCLAIANGAVTLGDCTTAPSWQLDREGELTDGTSHCLTAAASGEVAYGACGAGTAQRFFVDDEGHVWSAILPTGQPNMELAHLACLTPASGTVRAALCGQASAPTWQFVPAAVATPRAALGLAATGRAMQIGDIDGDGYGDLCAVEADALACALGDGAGGFDPAITFAPFLPVEPASLALGDVDGDGRIDACGQASDGTGVLCALSSAGFATRLWTSMFGTQGSAHAVPATTTSLGVVAAAPSGEPALCGMSSIGLACLDDERTSTAVLTTWPRDRATVWTAELDGDRDGDWCSASPHGPVCAPSGEKTITHADGVPWGFSLGGIADPSPQDADTGALADVDGDGRADLCGLDLTNARVACARSQGRGFGPRTTLFAWPAGIAPTALWLGDLDGDGKADACVDAGATIACAISP
jgi:LmbE family N-acetylglucosaminyl deacetylase